MCVDFIFGHFLLPAVKASNSSQISMDSHSPNKGVKHKRVLVTPHQKIDICKQLEKGEKHTNLMREYNVDSSTIYNIQVQKRTAFHILC